MSQPPPGGSRPPGDQSDAGAPSAPPGNGSDTGHGSTGPIPTVSPSSSPSLSKNPGPGQDNPGAGSPPPTSYQPAYQQGPPPGYPQHGPPPGYQQGPPPGYQQSPPQGPPPGYQQGPPPGYQQGPPAGAPQGPPPGYQQGPPPGYQQGPPPGYQQGPPPGYQQGPPPGYQQAGYPPPGPYGPPGQPGQPGYPPGAYPPPTGGSSPSFDASKVTIAGWGVLGSSLLTLIVSFFPFWSVSATGFIALTISLNGWSLWWWLPVLLAVAVGVVYALEMFGVLKPTQVKPEWLVYAAAASFVLMLGVLIQTLVYAGSAFGGVDDVSHGPSFGVFIAVITTAALTYFMALAAQSSGAKLPFKVPGPA